MKRDSGLVANGVLQHLASLVGADVQVTLETQVQLLDPVPDLTKQSLVVALIRNERTGSSRKLLREQSTKLFKCTVLSPLLFHQKIQVSTVPCAMMAEKKIR